MFGDDEIGEIAECPEHRRRFDDATALHTSQRVCRLDVVMRGHRDLADFGDSVQQEP